MRKLLFAFAFFAVLNAGGQNHLISFEGTGESEIIDHVNVENLSTGITLTLNGTDILHLTGTTGISQNVNKRVSAMRIYPNPVPDNATIEIFAPAAGDAVITVYDITGKRITQAKSYLKESGEEFRLSGTGNGFYLINVTGDTYQFSGRLQSIGEEGGVLKIEKVNSTSETRRTITSKKNSEGSGNVVDMQYSNGERLKFTAVSGIYSTVKTDIPTQDKTLTFYFIPCTDGDNNNYPVVEIGTQVWMAENLKTTKYSNGDSIGTTNPPTLNIAGEIQSGYQWAYEGTESNVPAHGRFYTWYAVTDIRNVCPAGWHVSTDEEWTILTDFLGGENTAGGILKGTGTSHWDDPRVEATDENGFTARPGGFRRDNGYFEGIGHFGSWWSSSEYDPGFAWYRSLFGDANYIRRLKYSKNYGYSVRCLKDTEKIIELPALVTQIVTNYGKDFAYCGGEIISDGGAAITARGVCWSLAQNPTIDDSMTINGNGNGTFYSSLKGLIPGTTYYVRAYATNSAGTGYGNEINFNTYQLNPITKDYGTKLWYFHPYAGGSYPDDPYLGIQMPVKTLIFIEERKAETWFGLWKDESCWITINADNSIGFEVSDSWPYDVKLGDPLDSTKVSHFDPLTDIIYLYYHYSGSTGNRIFWEIFTPILPDKIYDYDGNIYNTVIIGTQTWMAENLKVTKYNDGKPIPYVTDSLVWAALSTAGYCWYNNDEIANKATYGALYNGYTINTGKLCPTGWHVPSDPEWTELTDHLGGTNVAGDKLKEAGTTHWIMENAGATNETGFTALPGGLRILTGIFLTIGGYGTWWSSTESETGFAWTRYMDNVGSTVRKGSGNEKDGYSVRCVKNILSTLSTKNIADITSFTATSGGDISFDGGSSITARGICWSTSTGPSITDNHTNDGNSMGEFTSLMNDLLPNITYYVRAYATNKSGIAYGNEIVFTTAEFIIPAIVFNPELSYDSVVDIEGNTYKTIVIGTHEWMAENLKTTKYNNGDLIGTTDPTTFNIAGESNPKYQWASFGVEYKAPVFGRLYTWYAVNDDRNICPAEWHVPTDAEVAILIDLQDGENNAGGKMKENGISHWKDPNTGATNQSGFTALPAGDRFNNAFNEPGKWGFWWTSSETSVLNASYFLMLFSNSNAYLSNEEKYTGNSVRCLRNTGSGNYNYLNPTKLIYYRQGLTPSIAVNLEIPQGAAVKNINVSYYFLRMADSAKSNTLSFDVEVNGTNVTGSTVKSLPFTWESINNGIVLPSDPQIPASDTDPGISAFLDSYWEFSYIINYSDGNKVLNNKNTKVSLANVYAGKYLCTGVFHHPTAGIRPINKEKTLSTASATKCSTGLGDLGEAGYDIYINVEENNSCTVTAGPNQVTDVFMSAGRPNVYYPDTKSFELNYYYVGASGNRVIEEYYILLE